MKSTIFMAVCSLMITAITSEAQAPSAESVLKEAQSIAAKENKNVFIIFHASWCGWCHKMDSSMAEATVSKFFTDSYVIRHLTVQESEKNKRLENPGAQQLLTTYHGKDLGIPFWLIFDKQGNLLADSKRRSDDQSPEAGYNVGCPANETEIDYFITVLRKTSNLDEAAFIKIREVFRRNRE